MPNALNSALTACRQSFWLIALFSLADSLLLLIVPLYTMQLYDRVLTTRSVDTLIYLTIIAIAGLVALGLLDVAKNRLLSSIGQWLDRRLGPETYARAIAASQQGLGYRTEALRDLGQVRGFLAGPNILAFFDMPWVPIFVVAITLLHPILGAVAATSALLLFALALLNNRLTKNLVKSASEASMRAFRQAETSSRNAEVVDALGMTNNLIRQWADYNDAALTCQKAVAQRSGWIMGVSKFSRLAIQIVMMGAGAWLAVRQELTGGAMIAGSIILSRALAPVERSISAWKAYVDARTAYDRLLKHLALPILRPASMRLPPPQGRIELERVGLKIRGMTRPIVDNICFVLMPGETLGIMGPSAAGKSSLGRLIIGTRPPSAGHVRLDGADITFIDRTHLAPFVGYVPQDVELFSGTVAENIARMGLVDDDAVVAAAQAAGVHEMILRLPRGYETEIGEGGSHLSGGQRQRIALARAVFGDPRLVVLDEPDASLDVAGQQALMRTLENLKASGCTIVMITHRRSLLEYVDKLLVMIDGNMFLFGAKPDVLARLTAVSPPPLAKVNTEAAE
jgi:PrtD family type I secretion system ABC transporter